MDNYQQLQNQQQMGFMNLAMISNLIKKIQDLRRHWKRKKKWNNHSKTNGYN